MKINIGSHNKQIEGFLNMDILKLENVHIAQDITEPPYVYGDSIIEDDTVDEIIMHDVLEHISFRDTQTVLREIMRILRPGGKLNIVVPDIGKMCEYFAKSEICECVPHKAQNWEFKAQENCAFCNGIGKINPIRWQFALGGAQKHAFDNHLNHFTASNLRKDLQTAGFENIKFNDKLYKIDVTCIK